MAYPVFFLVRGLTECLAQLVAEEVRIVAEAMTAPRRVEDPAVAITLADRRNSPVRGQVEQNAAVAGQSPRFRSTGQPAQQLGVIGGIDLRLASRRAGPPLRMHARRPPKREDLEP